MSSDPNPNPPPLTSTSAAAATSSPTQPSPSRAKLRKIPPIPIRRSPRHLVEVNEESEEEGDDDEEDDDDDFTERKGTTPILLAASLGLNHIRTRSAPSPLRFSSSACTPLNLGEESNNLNYTVKSKPQPGLNFDILKYFSGKLLNNMSWYHPILYSECIY